MAKPGHTTDAYTQLAKDNVGIGFRPGPDGKHNRLKGNRAQKSKQKMRVHMGMVKPKG
jgi:hypothetical protein